LADPSPFVAGDGGVSVIVRLTPKAAEDRVGPVARDLRGQAILKAAVTAPPADGKANTALIRLLAKSWGLPKTAISLKRGAKNRIKTLFIESADPEQLVERLTKNL